MKHFLLRLWKEEEGQDLIEYALLILLIALVAVTTLKPLGSAISSIFANATSNLTGQ
ncbi:MAG: Flp family type IVb pilin [Candidatus Acidiferrales bacterium]|jgi:Flp pilus assembly pilin Flp